MPKEFGENLKILMESRNLTASKLGRDLGISVKTIHEWLGSGGRTPRNLKAIKKLSQYFEVSTHYLLFGEDDPKDSVIDLLNKTEIHTGIYEISIKKLNTRKPE